MLHPVYYIIMVAMTLGSYIEFTTGKKLKFFFITICVVLVIIAGIRVGQGADYWPYLGIFLGANKYVPWNMVFDGTIGIEPTYILLSKIIGSLYLPFTIFLLTFAAISISLKGKIIYNFSPLPIFSLLCFFMPGFFASDMGHMRQSLAASICMFSFRYISDQKLYKYLICLYFAYLTHKTAMVFIPAYWIANMNISTIKAFFIVVLGVILWPIKPYLIIGGWLNSISTDNLATESYNSYATTGEDMGFTITEVVKIILLIIIFTNDRYIIKQGINKNYMKVRNLIIAFYFFYYAFHGNPIFSVRLASIYQIFDSILVAMILAYSRQSRRFIIYTYYILYFYIISWRFWGNAKLLEFDKFSNIFNDPRFSIFSFTPHEFASDKRDGSTYKVE